MENNLRYILGAKPGDHAWLFGQIESSADVKHVEVKDSDGVAHSFRYLDNVSLNASHPDLKVNFLVYHETRPGTKKKPESKTTRFSWVTDIPINPSSVMKIMRAGRARWRIENETFNTLKNQGYNLEHNFGHGNKNLATVFGCLMLLAFLVDQIESRCCPLFAAAFEKQERLKYLREKVRSMFKEHILESREFLYKAIAGGYISSIELLDTS